MNIKYILFKLYFFYYLLILNKIKIKNQFIIAYILFNIKKFYFLVFKL